MPVELPSLDEIRDRAVDSFKAAFPDDDVSPDSDNYKRLTIASIVAWQMNYNISQAQEDLFVDTAAGDPLDHLGFIFGVERKGATPARKSNALRVVGAAAASVSIGDLLTSDGGLTFQVNENFTFAVAGFEDVDVIGVSTGSQTALPAGETLRFTTPPAGIETAAQLQLDLDEDGQDEESDGEYRVRILNAIQQPGAGGNTNDYVQFAIEEDGIATAFVYPLRAGRGTVDIVALHAGSGTVRVLTEPERAALELAIDAKRPVSLKTGTSFRVLVVTTSLQNVEATVNPLTAEAFQFDWDDTTPPTVVSWVAGTRLLTLSARPADMLVGDRLIIKTVAGNGTGKVFTVEALSGAAAVILNAEPVPAPVSPDIIYAGGPSTETLRAAVLALIDAFGTARGLFADGDWQSDLVPEEVLSVMFFSGGIVNGTVITPASTITPTDPAFPLDGTIELLIPQEIIVRKA